MCVLCNLAQTAGNSRGVLHQASSVFMLPLRRQDHSAYGIGALVSLSQLF
jgi:hypothetical protein